MLAVIFIASLLPTEHLPQQGNDKLNHLVSYAILAWWSVLAFCSNSYKKTFILAFKLIIFGGVIELLQGWSGYRYAEWQDLLANSIGIFIGCVVAIKLTNNFLISVEAWISSR